MEIKTKKDSTEIEINGYTFTGFIHDEKCSHCNHNQVFNDIFDASFCPNCNKWITPVCGSEDCSHNCSKRPEKPLPEKIN